jgi:hypothetical protein
MGAIYYPKNGLKESENSNRRAQTMVIGKLGLWVLLVWNRGKEGACWWDPAREGKFLCN